MTRANDRMLDLDKLVIVQSHDKEVYKDRIKRPIGALAKTLGERGDPKSIFSGEVVVALRPQAK